MIGELEKPSAVALPRNGARSALTRVPEIPVLEFALPPELAASEPPEARGLARDEVRLMVSYRSDNRVVHARFRNLPDFLAAGDVLVINTSGTMNAALDAIRADGTPVELHLSTRLPTRAVSDCVQGHAPTGMPHLPRTQAIVPGAKRSGMPGNPAACGGFGNPPRADYDIQPKGKWSNRWIVELRRRDGPVTKPYYEATVGETIALPGGASATLHAPYLFDGSPAPRGPTRLWIATLCLRRSLQDYLAQYGFPIRYSYVKRDWPGRYYQTVYATEMGSAEMPSAGRGFTPELITRLIARGVQIVPLLLHTGVASLENHEPPYEEFYRVPAETARAVNAAREAGQRVIAVGTTVVRALETVSDPEGTTNPGEGWTRLVITPRRGLRAVDALLTGLHEPRASHLAMIETLAGIKHLQVAYAEALREGYLWHEFGDLHLIL